ncbi:MAG: CHASE3 domain-containing protein, partial [Candidatus Marsarchaeota archaeon]|nr:CHASE3 domain-containing protein [Candidatus Marsarchaeota archaeon]
MKWSIGVKLAAGFTLAFALLVLIGALSYQTMTDLISHTSIVEDRERVVREIHEVLASLRTGESDHWNYIVTGDETYLAAYRTDIGDINQHIDELTTLTANDPDLQRRLDTLQPLIAQRIESLQKEIDLRRSTDLTTALQSVGEAKGKELDDTIRQQMGQTETT